MKHLLFFTLPFIMFACQTTKPDEEVQENEPTTTLETSESADPHSFSQPEESKVTHLNLDLNVDFEQKKLIGTAAYELENAPDAKKLVLDTRDLTIKSVLADGQKVDFELGAPVELLGRPLTVPISPETKKVTVSYETSSQAAGLQWLSPAQTDNKKYPFLFSQSQAILASTWVPCQDSPGIRMTYEATLEVPTKLFALMSATNPQQKNAEGVYRFKMEQPIPSYLLAISVGDLQFQALSDRAGVYAAPSVLDKAAYEFGDLEEMIVAAEELYGKYRWERYDILVLPASFPFGGMENPRLTFATPTILAGDRSLVSLVAHELAHSWSGNLVTNETWDDFWLNEGFTVYFENRIMEKVYGKEYSEMLALISKKQLEKEISEMMPENAKDTHLKLDLVGRDPDEGLTAIAYDKGYFFLRHLEESFGRTQFDKFLKGYFAENAFKTMNTKKFLNYLSENLTSRIKDGKEKAMPEAWIYEAGLPMTMPEVTSEKYDAATNATEAWIKGDITAEEIDTEGWKYQQYEFLLRKLPETLTDEQLTELDAAFGFSNSGNSEILGQWFLHVARNEYEPVYPTLKKFLMRVGRRKFIAPIYAELAKHESSKAWALEVYEKARPNYHFVAYDTIDKILAYNK